VPLEFAKSTDSLDRPPELLSELIAVSFVDDYPIIIAGLKKRGAAMVIKMSIMLFMIFPINCNIK